MRKLASFVAILVLICLLIPSLTFAAWWNPLSWFETKNNVEISMEISSSTPSASAEIKTEYNWWNPFSWVKKEKIPKQENVSQENLASTTEEIISENDGLDSETPADLELKTAQAKAEAEKYKSEAEQAKLEVEKLKRESESKMQIQTQTQTEVKKEENKNTTVTLPSGAIVEMDEHGNIVRTIQEAPEKPSEPTQANQQPEDNTNFPAEIKLEIGKVDILLKSLETARIQWSTNIPTESKIFISENNYPSQVFMSESGLSTNHFVNLKNFSIENDSVYKYEIEAINPKENTFEKNLGEFTLLSRPYLEIFNEIRSSVYFNPNLTCFELFSLQDKYMVCLKYRDDMF